MLIIGLTGSLGMGKSTAAARFRFHDIPVFDADAEVHRLYGGPAAAVIGEAFPGTESGGGVDRKRLAKAVIGKPDALRRLEAIVHPLIRDQEKAFLLRAWQEGHAMAVLEIPLLFETAGDDRVDVTVVVSAAPQVRRQRVLARPRMTRKKLNALLAQQMPDDEKRARADYIVDTSGTIADTYDQIDKLIESLKGRSGVAITNWQDLPSGK